MSLAPSPLASPGGAPIPAARARKATRAGTHRACLPAETLARLRGLLPILGVTRIADVTGLDVIGIPTVMVVRPGARSLSVSQGKGQTLDDARVSGLMESIEMWHAERIDSPLKLATLGEIRYSHRMVDVAALPRLSVSRFDANQRTLWIEGKNLFDGKGTWVPYEMVHTDYTLPLPSGSGSFLMSSSGLASGNHLLEAQCHALCELIERDALTLHRIGGKGASRRARLDLDSVDDPGCRALLERYERAGVEVAVWDITSDIGIAAFSCTIVDRDPSPARPVGPMGGCGCHPSRAIALSRALTEAAQSRLTVISGAREDVRHQGPDGAAADLEAARGMKADLDAEAPTRRFSDVPHHENEFFEDDLALLLERLRGAGLREAILVDLTKPIFQIPVVRVIVPGLEPLNEVPGYVPGLRATMRARARMEQEKGRPS